MNTSPVRFLLLPAMIVVGILAVALLAQATASGGEKDALRKLVEIEKSNNKEKVVVAEVNGEKLYLHQIETAEALAQLSDVMDAAGRPTQGASRRELLNRLIEEKLLLSEAKVVGITVTEQEVDMMVNAGIVEPFKVLSGDRQQVYRTALKLAGTSPETAMTSAELRESLANWLLVNRYVGDSGTTREELVEAARARASIISYSDRLGGQP